MQAQASLQTTHLGHTLQANYLDTYLGAQASDTVLKRSKAVRLWDRLAGRLCARLAWKKISLLLHWLSGQLAFTDGTEGRINWMSGKVRPGGRRGGSLIVVVTEERCSTHTPCGLHLPLCLSSSGCTDQRGPQA